MTAMAALRELERRLLHRQVPIGVQEAWEAYADVELVDDVVAQQQGFEAGYAAAMTIVRSELAAVQTEALRSSHASVR